MAEYQYNVEVKSRFALFLDDSISNEDPNLLLSKIQKKREKTKKDKVQVVQQPSITTKNDELPKPDARSEPVAPKVQPTSPKPSKTPAPPEIENGSDAVVRTPDGTTAANTVRGRGSHRPPSRGFRGGRGQGSRAYGSEMTDVTDEAGDQRESHFDGRGRGRGRGRGMFTRGGTHFNDRKFDNINHERVANRPFGERDDRDSQVMATDDRMNGDEHPANGDNQDSTELNENGEDHAPTEEEPKIYTLAEYKAMKKLTKPTVVLNTQASRQANDGKDVFANMVVIHKAREVPTNTVKMDELEPQEHTVDVSFTEGSNSRGRGRPYRELTSRGDRGNYPRGPRTRGGGRGRGRGGFRESRDRDLDGPTPARYMPPPSLDNDVEFPSLT